MNLHAFKKTSRRKADRRWTLLFIGDHGNVFTLKRFKAIIFAVGLLFLLALVLLVVLFWSHQKTQQKYSDLQNRHQRSQQQIETLRHEKEILMARLVLAESEAKRAPKESPGAAEPVKPEPQKAARAKPAPEPQKKPPAAARSQPPSADGQSREAEAIMQVTVENFKVFRESGNPNIKAEFKIKNTSRGYQRAAGNAVVVLKGAELSKDQWLVMPTVGLSGQKPSGKRGKRFSIRRFFTMIFSAKAPNHADQFETAVVYVFTEKGKLLLEQDFAISLPPLPTVAPKPPAGDTPNREARPAETPPRQPTPPQAQPQKTPAAPETPVDDILDSLEDAPLVF